MKKEIYYVVLGVLLRSTLTSSVPVSNEESEIISSSSRPPGTCLWEGKEYLGGDQVPSPGPCEQCICQPPDVKCNMIKCKTSSGCKVIQRANHCCPYYKCDCEHKGRTYNNGERLDMPEDPCQVCYCKGGEIMCTSVTCYERTDCQPRFTPGQCCPKYDHCPFQAPPNATKSVNSSVYGSKREIQPWLMTKSTTAKPTDLAPETTKAPSNETAVNNVFPQTLKIHEILPTTPSYEQTNGRKNGNNLHIVSTTQPVPTSEVDMKDILPKEPEHSTETIDTTTGGMTETSYDVPTQLFETGSSPEGNSQKTSTSPDLTEQNTEYLLDEDSLTQKSDGPVATIKMRSMSGDKDFDKLLDENRTTEAFPVDQEGSSTAFPDVDVTVKDPPFVLKGGLYEAFNETAQNTTDFSDILPSEEPTTYEIERNTVDIPSENSSDIARSSARDSYNTEDAPLTYEQRSETDMTDDQVTTTVEPPRSSDQIKDVEGENGINLYIFGQDVATNETVLYTVLTPADLKTLAQILINKKIQKSENFHQTNAEVKVGWLPSSDALTGTFMLETAKLNLDSLNCDKAEVFEGKHEYISKPEKLSYSTSSTLSVNDSHSDESPDRNSERSLDLQVSTSSATPLLVYEVPEESSELITQGPTMEVILTETTISQEPLSDDLGEIPQTKQVEPVDLNDLESNDKRTLQTTADPVNEDYRSSENPTEISRDESTSTRKVPDVEPFLKQLPTSLDQRDVSILRDLLERHFSQP